MRKEVIIITKYFVPNKVVDSESVYQMIVRLKQLDPNLTIHIVTTDSTYKSEIIDADKYNFNILSDLQVHKIQSVQPKSNSSLSKFIANLKEGYHLVKKANELNIVNIISLSNPTLILMWCNLYLKKKKFFYWSFDLYPDALVADEILSQKSILYKFFHKLTYSNNPKVLIALGNYQYAYLCKKFKKTISKIILPCGIHEEKINKNNLYDLPGWVNDEKITLGYIGNIGRAHSLQFLKNIITLVKDRKDIKLILSFYGFHANSVNDHIKQINANNIVVVDFIEKKFLNLIDINLVSLKDSWNNISVPSKAVSAICSGSSLWFCGPEDSDTWGMFNSCSYKSSENINDVKKVLNEISKNDVSEKRKKALLIKDNLIDTEKLAYMKLIEELNSL